jgi:hypothetical protein
VLLSELEGNMTGSDNLNWIKPVKDQVQWQATVLRDVEFSTEI